MSDERLKIAVFIDFDNVEIGVKTTLGLNFDIGAVLEAIKERGEIITKVAYGDWKRSGDYGRAMANHAVRLVQRVMTPGGDKNGADINLALDALEMAFTHDHINAFVIVGGDSDFITLVEKLKQYDKKVFVVGGRAVHQPGDAEELHRVHRLREHRAGTGGARVSRRSRRGRRRRSASARRMNIDSVGAARAARAQGAGRPRGHAAARPAEEHAAAARLVVLGTRLRREQLPRLRREAGREGHRAAEAHRPQHAGRAERGRARRWPMRPCRWPTRRRRGRGRRRGRRRRRRRAPARGAPRAPREIDPATAAAHRRGRGARARAAGRSAAAAALADVPAPDQAVHPRQPSRLRRPQVRLDRRPDARLPEGRPDQARTRSPGRPARVRRRRFGGAPAAARRRRRPDAAGRGAVVGQRLPSEERHASAG